MKPITGKKYIWQGKREFLFLDKIGSQYYFTCTDYFGPGDPGTVTLKAHELKELKHAA